MSFIMKRDKGYYDEEDAIVLSYDLVGSEQWILTEKDFDKPLSAVTKQDIEQLAKQRFKEGALYDKELSFNYNVDIEKVNVLDSNEDEHLLFNT